MRARYSLPVSATSLLVSAISCAVLILLSLRGTEIFPWKNILTIDVIIALSMGLAVTTTFFTSFHRALFLRTLNPFADPRSLIAEATICQLLALLLFGLQKLDASATFISLIVLQTLTSWNTFALAAPTLKIQENTSKRLPWIAASSVIIYGFVIWPTRNFWRVDLLIGSTAIWQAVSHVAIMGGVMAWHTFAPRHQLAGTNFLTTIKLRTSHSGNMITPWTSAGLAAILNLANALIIWTMIRTEEHNYPLSTIAASQFLFLPALLDAWQRLNQAGHDQATLKSLSRFTDRGTKKLFDRYSAKTSEWAATIGTRSSVFTIDHDPTLNLSGKLPASLLAIRDDEIASTLNQLIGDQNLSSTAIAHRIVGVIDPDQSVRPCVDALNLFATLYLDAGALVERRLKSLVELLPIVNPGLAKHVSAKAIGDLLSQNQWFFHFDFNWIDQKIVNTRKSSRHGVMVEPIADDARIAILNQMRKTHGVGNFLWVGKEAHDRLLQEAPNLTTIMEPHQVRIGADREMLLFAIKFEQLVPRLQRYYGLDNVRQKIIDYEPTSEAQRLLRIMTIQIDNARGTPELKKFVESVASYPWRGFKEKDMALKLLQRVFELHNLADNPSHPLIPLLQDAATKIGYPSQIMTQAQIKKLELRDLKALRKCAFDQGSGRFDESWALLASMDYSRMSEQESLTIFQLIDEASCVKAIMSQGITPARMIDATLGLIRRNEPKSREMSLPLLNSLIIRIARHNPDPEIMMLALDASTFCKEQYASLKHRWQEYKTRHATQTAAARRDQKAG